MDYGNSMIHTRTLEKVPSNSRRRCTCGCKKRATHIGCANGLGMTGGCELSVRRWVKDPKSCIQQKNRSNNPVYRGE